MINKKLWILGTAIIVLLVILVIAFQDKLKFFSPEEQPKTVIKIGYTTRLHSSFALFIAQKEGIFDEYGLEVQLKEMESIIVNTALLAKEIDYYSGFDSVGAMASLQGGSIKIIMGFFEKTPPYVLVAQPGLGLNDLVVIGITHWQTPSHYLALKIIEENNLSAEIVPAGQYEAVLPLLATKQIDATVVPMTIGAFRLTQVGNYTILKVFDEEISEGLVTTEDKIKNNPEEVEKMVKAVLSAIKFIKDNPEESKELLFEFAGLDKTEPNQKIVEEVYIMLRENFGERGVYGDKGINTLIKLSKAGIYETLEDIEKQIVTDEDIAAVFDFRFVK